MEIPEPAPTVADRPVRWFTAVVTSGYRATPASGEADCRGRALSVAPLGGGRGSGGADINEARRTRFRSGTDGALDPLPR